MDRVRFWDLVNFSSEGRELLLWNSGSVKKKIDSINYFILLVCDEIRLKNSFEITPFSLRNIEQRFFFLFKLKDTIVYLFKLIYLYFLLWNKCNDLFCSNTPPSPLNTSISWNDTKNALYRVRFKAKKKVHQFHSCDLLDKYPHHSDIVEICY